MSLKIEQRNMEAVAAGTQIAVFWDIEDILGRSKNDGIALVVSEAKDILQTLKLQHDASIGINWEVIDACIANFVRERDDN